MKRKGFTLVELLAVIVILAVIALITIPLIGNTIENSKKKALETSVSGIAEAANYFAISNDGVYEFVFDESKKGETETGKKLNYKGQVEAEGKLYIDNEKNVSFCFTYEDYYAYKNYNSGVYVGNINDDTCIIGYDALTNKYIAMLDNGSGTVSNVYSKSEVDSLVTNLQDQITKNSDDITALTTIVNNNSNSIENLKSGVTGNLNMRYDEDTDMIQFYINNGWVDWRKASLYWDGYLYNAGAVNASYAGNPVFNYVSEATYYSYQLLENQIRLYNASGRYLNGTFTNKIDLTNYSKLIIKGTGSQGAGSSTNYMTLTIGISKNTIGSSTLASGCERTAVSNFISSAGTLPIEVEMDISDINGEYYIYYEQYMTASNGKYGTILIDEVRVE